MIRSPEGLALAVASWYTSAVVAANCSWSPPFTGHAGSAQDLQTKSALRPGSSVVERGPEKAGVGGSIPSLATIISITSGLFVDCVTRVLRSAVTFTLTMRASAFSASAEVSATGIAAYGQ